MRRPAAGAVRRALAVALGCVALAACARLLGLREPGRRPFPHRAHVLRGVSCTACHAGVERAGDVGPLHLPDDASCRACHKQPNSAGVRRVFHERYDERSCLGCHSSEWAAPDAAQARDHLRFTHAGHQDASRGNCSRCHSGIKEAGERLRPAMAVCVSCHEHKDQLATRACDRCHVDLAEEGEPPRSHLVHDGDWLRDHGARAAAAADLCSSCHAERFCGSCHGSKVPALPSALAFDDPGRASVHRAGFAARHSIEASAQPGLCSSCHAPESCTECHASRGVAPAAVGGGEDARDPHPPGWVGLGGPNEHGRAARRDPASCAACHGGAGEALCVGCHRVGAVGGSIHPPGWTSTRPMSALPCRLCHSGGGRP